MQPCHVVDDGCPRLPPHGASGAARGATRSDTPRDPALQLTAHLSTQGSGSIAAFFGGKTTPAAKRSLPPTSAGSESSSATKAARVDKESAESPIPAPQSGGSGGGELGLSVGWRDVAWPGAGRGTAPLLGEPLAPSHHRHPPPPPPQHGLEEYDAYRHDHTTLMSSLAHQQQQHSRHPPRAQATPWLLPSFHRPRLTLARARPGRKSLRWTLVPPTQSSPLHRTHRPRRKSR